MRVSIMGCILVGRSTAITGSAKSRRMSRLEEEKMMLKQKKLTVSSCVCYSCTDSTYSVSAAITDGELTDSVRGGVELLEETVTQQNQ